MARSFFVLLSQGIVLCLIIISNINLLLGQEVDNIMQLKTHLQNYYDLKEQAELEEYKDIKKLTWLLFIPGIGYDFINQNPYVVYNTSSLFSYFNTRIKQSHKRENIKKENKLTFRTDQIKLERLYLRLMALFNEYELEKSVYADYCKLYEINSGKYHNNEIGLENLLLSEIQLKRRQQYLYNIEEKIHDIVLQLELLVHNNINYSMPDIEEIKLSTFKDTVIHNDTITTNY